MCDDRIKNNINEIYVNTGNLLESEELKRKITILPGEEVFEGLQLTLESWIKNKSENEKLLSETSILIKNQKTQGNLNLDQNNNKANIKVFLFNNNKTDLENSINFISEQLNLNVIDSLTLSFTPEIEKNKIDLIKPLWSVIEEKKNEKKLIEIGVSDLNTNELIEFYETASIHKPNFNQIKIDSCCTIPPEMSEFAKKNNVRLLTHNDLKDVLTKDKVCQLFGCKNESSWQRKWLIRYSIMSRNKGIVQNKGYVLFVAKN